MDASAAPIAALLDALGQSSSPCDTDKLIAHLLAAIDACSDSSQVCRFVGILDDKLGELDYARMNDNQQSTWRWLVVELQVMEETGDQRFDDSVSEVLQRLHNRIDIRHQNREEAIEISILEASPATANEPPPYENGHTAWDTITQAFRDSSRFTLHRLLSGDAVGDGGGSNADSPRESIGSTDRPSSTTAGAAGSHRGTRRSQRRNHADDKGIPLLQNSSSSVSDAMPTLLRSFSSMLGVGMEETFLCQICFEHAAVADAIELSSCSHRYCFDCFKMYLELKISEGQVYPVCFHETAHSRLGSSQAVDANEQQGEPRPRKTCGVPVPASDIEALVSTEIWAKYLTFKFNKENEYGRQCPYCHESQLCKGPEEPEIVCSACDKSYCFIHGNAHADGSCADYELKQSEADKLNRSAIAEIAKPCPGCQNNVEKSGGCNHMKCIVCNTDFCWICGIIVDSAIAPTHFQWWNLRGCAGQQMEDVDAQTPTERYRMAVFRVLFLVVLGPPAFVLTVALTLLSCFCLPCMKALSMGFFECFTTCLNFMAMALFFALLGIAMALAFIVGVLYEILIWPFAFVYFLCRRMCCPIPPPQATTADDDTVETSATQDPEDGVVAANDHVIVRVDSTTEHVGSAR